MVSPLLIITASLIGSPHCAGMCGGFVAVACQSSRPKIGQFSYHLGRMLTYVTLGGIAGAIGAAVNLAGNNYGFHGFASIVSALLLIVWGLASLKGLDGRANPWFLTPRFSTPWLNRPALTKIGADSSSLILGLCSGLLPCGWLYTYVTVAAGAGTALEGAAIMFFFWIGTLPILITVGSLSRFIATPLKKYTPIIASVMIVLAGAYSLYSHMSAGVSVSHSCH